jgi:hypothetical protein
MVGLSSGIVDVWAIITDGIAHKASNLIVEVIVRFSAMRLYNKFDTTAYKPTRKIFPTHGKM